MPEALLRRVRLPNGIWEPCCGDGAMARVLESHGHRVVGTDLVDRGYGETGRVKLTTLTKEFFVPGFQERDEGERVGDVVRGQDRLAREHEGRRT